MKLNMFLFGFIFIGYQISLLASELPEKFKLDPTLAGISGQEKNFKELEDRFERADLNDFEKLFLKENELKSMKQNDALRIVSDVEDVLTQWLLLNFNKKKEQDMAEVVRQQFLDIVKAVKKRLSDLQFYSSKPQVSSEPSKPQVSSEPSKLPAQPVQPEKPELSKADGQKIKEARDSFSKLAQNPYDLFDLKDKESFLKNFTTFKAASEALTNARKNVSNNYQQELGKLFGKTAFLDFFMQKLEEAWNHVADDIAERELASVSKLAQNPYDLFNLTDKESFSKKFTTFKAAMAELQLAKRAVVEHYKKQHPEWFEHENNIVRVPFSGILEKAANEVLMDVDKRIIIENVFDLVVEIKNNVRHSGQDANVRHSAKDASVAQVRKIQDCIDLAAAIK